MLTNEIKSLVEQFDAGELSGQELLSRYGAGRSSISGSVLDDIRSAIETRNGEDLEYCFTLAELLGRDEDVGQLLSSALLEDWHGIHEWIVDFVEKYQYEGAVDFLYQAAITNYDSRSYDDYHALARRCMFALKAIGTANASIKLELLAGSNDEGLARMASEILSK